MSVIEPLLRPLGSVLNRRIRANSEALTLCADLAGRQIAVRVVNSAIAASLSIEPDGVRLSNVIADEPEVLLEGSLLSLASLAGDEPMAAIRDGRVSLNGDADTAQKFQQLLALAKPDLEDDLASVFGDSAGRAVSEAFRSARRFGAEGLKGLGQGLGERFASRQSLPEAGEFTEFTEAVRSVRDHAARLSARLDAVRRAREAADE